MPKKKKQLKNLTLIPQKRNANKVIKKSDISVPDFLDQGNMSDLEYANNMSRLMSEITSLDPYRGNSLLKLEITEYRDGWIFLSLALPEGLLKPFKRLLESLLGFFVFAAAKSGIAKSEKWEPTSEEIQQQKVNQESFIKAILSHYDNLIKRKIPYRKAVSGTNRAMKELGHVHANYDFIFETLQKAGRFKGFYKKKKTTPDTPEMANRKD